MKRLLFILVILFSANYSNGQGVFIKWKTQPEETIIYKLSVIEKDTAHRNYVSSTAFSDLNYMAYMSTNKKGMIDVVMVTATNDNSKKTNEDTLSVATEESEKNANDINTGVQLRGEINADGKIESFYTKNESWNLLALLFELPGRMICVNESWQLDVHMISMDKNFKCDSSFHQNKATFNEIKKVGGETFAVVKYDIVEFVKGDYYNQLTKKNIPTIVNLIYHAIAEFSLERGRWVSYNGLMSIESTGFTSSSSIKEYKMIAQ